MAVNFESSVNGDIGPDTVLECGVCWWEFDPSRGDDAQDIFPGTSFRDLPEHWCCPQCAAPQSKFMVKSPAQEAAASVDTPEDRVAALVAAYEKAEKEMVGLPIHNGTLAVEAVGFRTHGDDIVGVVVTPWCMNIAILPGDLPSTQLGSKRSHAFPFGTYSFVMGQMDGVGLVETCSLFSPMDEFDAMETAREAAQAAIDGLFDVDEEALEKARKKQTRRSIFAGRSTQSVPSV
ncbi:MAG: [NiFe]-hydrogenase assembly chaperone HybE [Pseudomonadota bacterium]